MDDLHISTITSTPCTPSKRFASPPTSPPHKRASFGASYPVRGPSGDIYDSMLALATGDDGSTTRPISRRDKGKGRAGALPELHETVWARIFELYYEDCADCWHDSTVLSHAMTPLILSKYHHAIALPILYNHPHLSYSTIPSFLRSLSYPSYSSPLPKQALVRNLTIRASTTGPTQNPTNLAINPDLPNLLANFPFQLTTFTLKDTLVLSSHDADILFLSLRLIRPKKARLEIRMWDLYDSPFGGDITAATRPNIHHPVSGETTAPQPHVSGTVVRLDRNSRGVIGLDDPARLLMIEGWRDALSHGGELEFPAWWLEPPRSDGQNANAGAGQHTAPAVPAFNAMMQPHPGMSHITAQPVYGQHPTASTAASSFVGVDDGDEAAASDSGGENEEASTSTPLSAARHFGTATSTYATSAYRGRLRPRTQLTRNDHHRVLTTSSPAAPAAPLQPQAQLPVSDLSTSHHAPGSAGRRPWHSPADLTHSRTPGLISYPLAHSMRELLLSLLTSTWYPNLQAFSFVAFDPLASLIVRAPQLDFWTRVPIPHIRVHLPRGCNSLAVLKGAKEVARDRLRRSQRRGEADVNGATGIEMGEGLGPGPEDRIVGGDGFGGGLLHEDIRLFEIEVNTKAEMRDEVWMRAGEQLPPEVCRILVGEQDWRDLTIGPGIASPRTPDFDASVTPPLSPCTDEFQSPTFDFADLGSSDEETDVSELGGDAGLGEGEQYDAEKAREQARRVEERRSQRG